MWKITSAVLILLSQIGCNWVQVTADGENVRVGTASEMANCTRVGSTTAQTLDRVVLQRGGTRIQEELLTLARNEAAGIGGNAVVPESVITDGEQIFGVYRC